MRWGERMLNQQKLLKGIDDDLKICRAANPTDYHGRQRNILEVATLISHLEWTKRAGNDQAELEKIVQSLEAKQAVTALRGYQHWRELATESGG
jgi:hypothetical protein